MTLQPRAPAAIFRPMSSTGGTPAAGDGHFHLFVYGTLRAAADGTPHPLLASSERVGSGTVAGTLYETDESPALMLAGRTPVAGEIWRCPLEALADLDAYEAVRDGLYRRVAVRVDDVACWVYVAGPRLGPRLTLAHRMEDGALDD